MQVRALWNNPNIIVQSSLDVCEAMFKNKLLGLLLVIHLILSGRKKVVLCVIRALYFAKLKPLTFGS